MEVSFWVYEYYKSFLEISSGAEYNKTRAMHIFSVTLLKKPVKVTTVACSDTFFS